MGDDKVQDLKGKAKEAVGEVTGNEDLENKGKTDQAKASVKDAVGKVVDTVKDKIDDVKNYEPLQEPTRAGAVSAGPCSFGTDCRSVGLADAAVPDAGRQPVGVDVPWSDVVPVWRAWVIRPPPRTWPRGSPGRRSRRTPDRPAGAGCAVVRAVARTGGGGPWDRHAGLPPGPRGEPRAVEAGGAACAAVGVTDAGLGRAALLAIWPRTEQEVSAPKLSRSATPDGRGADGRLHMASKACAGSGATLRWPTRSSDAAAVPASVSVDRRRLSRT